MNDAACLRLLQWALPRMGLRWTGFRRVRRQVCRRLRRRVLELELAGFDAYRDRLEQDAAEWRVLDRACRITISRFCRDRGVFQRLEREVLPALASAAVSGGRRALDVWSAGCASGEEPYTLAILWRLVLAPRFRAPEPCIVASEAEASLLARAERARYDAGSLRELPDAWRAAAFDACPGGFELRPEFRDRVSFRHEDLRERMPDGPFDLILCRNLAFTYFDERLQADVLGRLAARLRRGGALVLGSHESLPADEAFEPWPGARAVWRRTGA